MAFDEFEIIDRFFKERTIHRSDVMLGIGDDAAVFHAPPAGRLLVVAADTMVEGVHFPEATEPAAIGHKALAVNLSDLAAVGADPAWATLCLTLPSADRKWLEGFTSGFFGLAEQFKVQLIGGDTTRGPLNIAVQLIGVVDQGGFLSRGGAKENDVIYVSGTLGDAGLGLRAMGEMLAVSASDRRYFMRRLNWPSPRVALGRAIAQYATAAIDISDGLVADLGHICKHSKLGAIVDVARLPVSPAYRRCLSRVGWETALVFGDDYELCFTLPPGDADAGWVEELAAQSGVTVTRIGHMTGTRIEWMYGDAPFSVHDQGYRHFP